MFQQAMSQSWNLAVLLFQDMYTSKPSYAYDDTLHVQCMVKYMIDCKIIPRFQGASLCSPAPPILSRARPHVKFVLLPLKRKADQAVMQSCSLHRRFSSQYQALDGLPSVAAPGARKIVSWSWLQSPAGRPAHVSHDSGHAELVWVVCTHILVHYYWKLTTRFKCSTN